MVEILSYNAVIPCVENPDGLADILDGKSRLNRQNKLALPHDLNREYPGINLCANVGYNAGRGALLNSVHSAYDPDETGVFCGTAYGGFFEGQKRQCDAFIKHGPRGITPSLSIYNGIHLTSDIFAIKHNIRGTNLTNTTGYIASGAAMMQAFDDLEDNVLSNAIVIGTEQVDGLLTEILKLKGQEFPGLYKTGAGALWLRRKGEEPAREHLLLRSLDIDSIPIAQWDEKSCSAIIVKSLSKTLAFCKLDAKDIDCVITCNNFTREEDMGYRDALEQLFNETTRRIEMVKMIGHYMGANPVLASVCSVLLLNRNAFYRNIAVIATDPSGMCFTCVIGR